MFHCFTSRFVSRVSEGTRDARVRGYLVFFMTNEFGVKRPTMVGG